MRSIFVRSATLLSLLALAPTLGMAQVHTTDDVVSSGGRVWRVVRAQYIVQSSSVQAARESVVRVGGEVSRELSVINAIAADLSVEQASDLRLMTGVHLFADHRVTPLGNTKVAAGIPLVLTDGTAVTAQANKFPTNYPMLVGADTMQQAGINGKGVTIAVLDTGLWNADGQNFDKRVLALPAAQS